MIGWARRLFEWMRRFEHPQPESPLADLFTELERESNQLVEDEIRGWEARQAKATR